MDFAIQLCSYVLGLPLQILTINAMVRGSFQSFPVLFAYVIASFLATMIEMPLSLVYYYTQNKQLSATFAMWYWRDEAATELLVFAAVISLIYYATARLASRRLVRTGLIAGAILFASVSLLVHFDPKAVYHYAPGYVYFGVWATAWTRDLKFGAAVLDLALWTMLIVSREKNKRLMMLSCALGIMFAGEAIGDSIRSLATGSKSHIISLLGGLIVLIADNAMLYIWWRTFRVPQMKTRG